jgi:hypothetical protein
METEWIVVAQDRSGKVEDIAVCNSLTLARMYSDNFAKTAPAHAVIRIFESRPVEMRNGTKSET